MDRFKDALGHITQYFQQHSEPFVALWHEGLSAEGIYTRIKELPFCLPQDIMRLYQWGDGLREDVSGSMTFVGSCELFLPHQLLSLDEAVCTYTYWVALAEELAKNWDDDPMEVWHPQWFPLAKTDRTYHVVWCALTPQATAPIYYISRAEDYTVELAYDSVTSMLETLVTCFNTGTYRLEATGEWYVDTWQEAQIRRALNPQRNAWWLAQVPGAWTAGDLVAFLKHSSRHPHDGGIAAKAAEALCALRDPQTVDLLLRTLQDDDETVRRWAVYILDTFRFSRAVELLIQTLDDRHWSVRFQAAMALGQCGDTRAVVPLIQALGDSEARVRQEVARAIGQLGDKQAVTPLIQALSDPDMAVRANAAQSLGQLGDRQAVTPLIQALNDPDMTVRANAAQSLGQLGDARAIAPLLQVMDEPELLGSAIYALGELRTPYAVPKLIRILESAAELLHQAAAEALGKIGDPRAVVVLLQVLQNLDHPACYDAVRALGEIGDSRALEPLSHLFHIQDRLLQHYARTAWDKIQASRGERFSF